MRNREAIIPAGMESVYDRIGYAPAIKVGDTVLRVGADRTRRGDAAGRRS
jgi:hypothetical protein